MPPRKWQSPPVSSAPSQPERLPMRRSRSGSRPKETKANIHSPLCPEFRTNVIMPPCDSRSSVFHQAARGDGLRRHLHVSTREPSIGFRDLDGFVLRDNEIRILSQHAVTMPAPQRSIDLGIHP